METLIRRRVLRRLIWVCTVCQLPFYGSPDYNGLKTSLGLWHYACLHVQANIQSRILIHLFSVAGYTCIRQIASIQNTYMIRSTHDSLHEHKHTHTQTLTHIVCKTRHIQYTNKIKSVFGPHQHSTAYQRTCISCPASVTPQSVALT